MVQAEPFCIDAGKSPFELYPFDDGFVVDESTGAAIDDAAPKCQVQCYATIDGPK